MYIGPRLIFQGTILGSLLLAFFGLIVTADAAMLFDTAGEPSTASAINTSLTINPYLANPGPKNNAPEQEQEVLKNPEESTPPEETICSVSDAYPGNILQWCELITRNAQKNNLPPDLIAAVMLQESGGQPSAYSHSGAVGLLQVMPRDGIATKFVCKNGPCFSNRPSIEELEDPEFNVAYGTDMLAGLIERYEGNVREALKSYGPMDVGYSYADKIISIYERYR